LCDCYLKWFPKWINETKVRGGQARCAHPENLKGRLVTQVRQTSNVLLPNTWPVHYFIFLGMDYGINLNFAQWWYRTYYLH
jgi:hypothetical protein